MAYNIDKKYIWLTIYLVGIILLSYVFFLFSNKTVQKKLPKIEKANITWSVSLNTWNNIDDTIEEISNNLWNPETTELTWTNEDEKVENIVPSTMIIWNIELVLANEDTTYDDIFDILWFSEYPKYKVKWKKIYIKKLDSIEYENEKSNIEQLIQKMWWDIAEVNWFGDKQLFANFDAYYKKDSVSLVGYNGNLYVMILPYDKYYEYENTIKKFLFIK